jgi:hypothetical protein
MDRRRVHESLRAVSSSLRGPARDRSRAFPGRRPFGAAINAGQRGAVILVFGLSALLGGGVGPIPGDVVSAQETRSHVIVDVNPEDRDV